MEDLVGVDFVYNSLGVPEMKAVTLRDERKMAFFWVERLLLGQSGGETRGPPSLAGRMSTSRHVEENLTFLTRREMSVTCPLLSVTSVTRTQALGKTGLRRS